MSDDIMAIENRQSNQSPIDLTISDSESS